MRALEHEHRLAARERETLQRTPKRGCSSARTRCASARKRSRSRLNDELERQVRQARKEIDDVIAAAEGPRRRRWPRRRASSRRASTGTARSEARNAVDAIAGARRRRRADRLSASAISQSASQQPQPGRASVTRVIVGGLGLEATVTAVHDGTADLDVRGKRMRASVRDLRIVGGRRRRAARVSVNVELQPRETTSVRPQRDRLHGRRSDHARRALPRRVAARRSARHPAHSRLRHRSAEASAHRISAAAPAGRAVSQQRRRNRAAAASRWWS